MRIDFLGQAGLYIQTKNCKLLCDPWFSKTGGFLATWHQFPPNDHIDLTKLRKTDYLYISHMHYDHFDEEFLKTMPKGVKVIIADFISDVFRKRIQSLGFSNIIKVKDWEKIGLENDFAITLVADSCKYKEDSCILIESEGFRILNKNDCYLTNDYLEKFAKSKIDLFFSQFSGAMWYPAIYEYTKERKTILTENTRNFLINRFIRIVNQLQPRYVVPSAGPPCFLEDQFFNFNFEGIFPDQHDIMPYLDKELKSKYNCMMPGDAILLEDGKIRFENTHKFDFDKKRELLKEYQKKRLPYITGYLESLPEPDEDLFGKFEKHITQISSLNEFITSNISQLVEFNIEGKNGGTWQVDFRNSIPTIHSSPIGQAQYQFWIDSRFLNMIINGEILWEDLFLSLRFKAKRDPDIYNWPLFSLLRYGHDENVLKMVELNELRTRSSVTINVKSGKKLYKIQGFCPHLGENLQKASVSDGILTCSRHNWQFDLKNNGKCIFGGDKDLTMYATSEIDNEEDEGTV